ncbi:MAG: enoyl-CoA hydratase/isomerase family protein [Actinomycetota bacterium]|nr:enoyl-CoA hydratase/isomerase family protein [Actinomycetota bacterium]
MTTYESLVADARADERRLVTVERGDAHAIVRMDDPERLNALSAPLTVQLLDALTELSADDAVRAVIITGTDPAFSAGGDLRLMREHAHPMVDESPGGATEAWRWIRCQFGAVARTIVRADKPVVAAVNGAAAGVGLAFALACDIVVASEKARIVPAFARIGLVPEVGNSWLITRRLGYQRAFELFTEGRILSGAEAAELGLVNELVTHDELMPAALAHVERMAALPPHVVPMTKSLLRQAADMTWDQAIAAEEFAEPMCFTTRGHREAVQAILTG